MIRELIDRVDVSSLTLIVGVVVAAVTMLLRWFRGGKKTTTVPLGDQYPGADKVAEAYEEHLKKKNQSRADRLAGAARRAVRRAAGTLRDG